MDRNRSEIYKFNPRIQDYKDQRREELVERRKSKRKDCFYQRRNCSDSEDSYEKQENEQPTVLKGKENRRDLLKKWKEEQKKETTKMKKPFVVGIVRHNAGSPMFKPVPPLREKKQTARPQAPTPAIAQSSSTSGVYCFGRQKPAAHKFKVASSVKKLTVPITPSFMDPAKRGNLTSKLKSDANGNKPPVAEKRVTRATKAAAKVTGAVKKSPMKRTVTNKVNVPSSSKAGPSTRTKVVLKDDNQTDKGKTAEVRKIIENFVLSPAVTKRVHPTAITAAEGTGAVKKSPLKRAVTNKVNVPSSSRAGPSRKTKVAFKDDYQTEKCRTAEVRKMIENFVLSPAVRTNTERVHSTAITAAEDKNEAEAQAPEVMEIETNDGSAMNTASPAQEFYDRLQRETDFLLECCDRWSGPAFTQTVPRDASDEIDSTVGQARLLVSDKFQQFKRLIQNFEEGSQPPVTSKDLNGFWDMINIQVDKMKERFDHLAELRSNNWTTKSADVIVKKKVAVKPKAVKPVSKSRFLEFMAKKRLEKDSNEASESQAVTPVEETQPKIGTPLKDRVMEQILDTSRSERRRSSLASASQVLRTSLIGKNLAMSPLMKTGEKSAIENRTSILRDNCPPSPLATFTGKARKKVEFGVEKSSESYGSPVVKRIPQTPKPCFVNLTDDDSDDETVTNTDADDNATSTVSQNIPRTPRFVISSNCMTDHESDSTILSPRTPMFEVNPNRLTDDESNASNNSSCPDSSRSPRLMNKSHPQQFTPDVSGGDRSTTSANRSTPNATDVTGTGGKKKKVGFGTVQPIESIGTPDENIDVSNTTPVASLSFESPKPRRSARIRLNTPYASRN
ncbi:hypothetical protein LSTR_LSTR001640 [Laodelphax striatellus]|uniref:IBB domain-containing protein n=1 Tax=Laodelphax striatellus TaxID=195883 RepID=A0A482XD70_LAOST|nr:hypothetical protein LSTR_LSTR001640 [Laodelphax striatellus]